MGSPLALKKGGVKGGDNHARSIGETGRRGELGFLRGRGNRH